jgi:signal transduction histidine kinase
VGASVLLAVAVWGAALGIAEHRLFPPISAVILCTVAVIALRLRALTVTTRRELTESDGLLAQAHRERDHCELAHRELLHDARTAVAGLAGGIAVLTRSSASAVRVDTRRLQRTMLAELGRLQSLLEPGGPEPIVDFDLATSLEPIVLTHQMAGARIHCSGLGRTRVRGRPHATASVLDNVLCNARVHAPGAAIRIQLSLDDANASVLVHDDGPGIPSAECDRVLLPGVRGSTASAPGSGLGLHSALTTMTDQHGALHVQRPDGGGTLVTFTLPLAHARRAQVRAVQPIAS